MITEKPQDTSTLFLDMNSYFARVEQQVQPTYRGKPVGITPYLGDSGCIIAASYEAKAYGAVTGLRVGEAIRICPNIIILLARPTLYHFYHKEIVKTLESFTPFLRILSIDEFSMRLTGRERNSESAKTLAIAIKQSLSQKVGDWMTASIGIAPNQFLAKTAAELKKPDGLFEIKLCDLKSIYQNLELTDLCGINRGVYAKCRSFGVYSVNDLYKQSISDLSRMFGILGKAWYFRLRGYEVDDITTWTKSIGHSHVLSPEYRSRDGARKILTKLTEKAGFRLRKDNYWATGIYLNIGFYNHVNWSKFLRVSPFQDSHTARDLSNRLFDKCCFSLPPLIINISLCGLIKNQNHTISLFPELQKQEKLSRAMDKINDKYGSTTLYPAALHGAEHSAPDRISFGRPRFEIINE